MCFSYLPTLSIQYHATATATTTCQMLAFCFFVFYFVFGSFSRPFPLSPPFLIALVLLSLLLKVAITTKCRKVEGFLPFLSHSLYR